MKMSAARKKSSTSTDDSSSTTSSGSSSSSGTSSGSDSVSSSSESDTSSTVEEKTQNQSKGNDSTVQKTNVNTRRKSSEVKTGGKVAESDKNSALLPTTKTRSTNASQRYTKSNDLSSEDEIPPKKPTRLLNINNSQRQKKPQLSSNQPFLNGGSGGGKAPPAVVKQHHQQNLSAKTPPNKINSSNIKGDDEHAKDNLNFSSVVSSENSENDFQENKKLEKKSVTKPCSIGKSSSAKVKPMVSRIHQKRSATAKSNSRAKSTDESESESGSSLGDGSTSTTESEQTESSNTSVSITQKKPRSKRVSDQNLDVLDETKSRNPTRSLNTRRTKHISGRVGGTISDSDSEVDANNEKFNPKIPTKKMATNSITTKAKTKKDCIDEKPRLPSPQPIIEKKCPIEGCDSSGHLSGNQDKHFLAEACPIYHNMSASECKERANERRQRAEFRQRILSSQQHSSKKIITPEQKEYLSKIRESRARFRPIMGILNSEKIKVEKDCPDDDREPSLSGLVPDYDLQLFREAQAIASEKMEEELMDLPVGKGIRYITMGKYKMKVWYQSPYPDDAARLPKMYICEFCLRYQKSETGIKRHAQKCVWRHPPGDEIYRKGKLQVWQVDGKRHKQYCQHLCLLAKFFLDHKTLYYDVEPFLFYIMTLADVDGCHTVGYFSKEKNSFYNVSCILTLPPYQRKGYGRLLIDFSYLLTRVEGKIGSPEKPLSDLGLISYRSYWKDVLLDYLCNRSGSTLSIKDVSQEMAIYSYDIVSTLQALGMMKYWKGKHIVLKKQDVLDEYEERVKRRGNFPKIDDSCLRWSPFVPPQTNASP